MHPARTRQIKGIGITAAAVALILGGAAPAWADPGNGNGSSNGNAPSDPPGQVQKTEAPAAPAAASTSPAPTPTATHVPPGQQKQPVAPPTGKGNSNAGGNAGGNHVAPGQAKKAAGGNTHGNNGGGKGKGANGPDGHNPPGNNGTVKIHALPGDPGHHNVAHPGCSFVVDFWGFDAGQTLDVSFTGQAPTGAGTPLSLTGSGTSVTSPDDAGGGNDPDGELVFTPTAAELSVLGAPAAQGYHVRLNVETGEPGGHKYKVFWISPCAPSTPDTPAAADTPTLSTDTPTLRTNSDTMSAMRSTPLLSVPELDTARVTRATPATPELQHSSPVLASLPFTGANLSTLIASGVLALLIGTAITIGLRRRREIG
jgi:hypothetical protein